MRPLLLVTWCNHGGGGLSLSLTDSRSLICFAMTSPRCFASTTSCWSFASPRPLDRLSLTHCSLSKAKVSPVITSLVMKTRRDWAPMTTHETALSTLMMLMMIQALLLLLKGVSI